MLLPGGSAGEIRRGWAVLAETPSDITFIFSFVSIFKIDFTEFSTWFYYGNGGPPYSSLKGGNVKLTVLHSLLCNNHWVCVGGGSATCVRNFQESSAAPSARTHEKNAGETECRNGVFTYSLKENAVCLRWAEFSLLPVGGCASQGCPCGPRNTSCVSDAGAAWHSGSLLLKKRMVLSDYLRGRALKREAKRWKWKSPDAENCARFFSSHPRTRPSNSIFLPSPPGFHQGRPIPLEVPPPIPLSSPPSCSEWVGGATKEDHHNKRYASSVQDIAPTRCWSGLVLRGTPDGFRERRHLDVRIAGRRRLLFEGRREQIDDSLEQRRLENRLICGDMKRTSTSKPHSACLARTFSWPVHSELQKVQSPNLPKEKCISEVARIGSIIIFHPSKLWKAKVFILCDIMLLARLQGKFEIDHSLEWKG